MNRVKHIPSGKVFTADGQTAEGDLRRYVDEKTKEKKWLHDWELVNSVDWVQYNPHWVTEDGVGLYSKSDKVVVVRRKDLTFFEQTEGDGIGTWLNGWYCTHLADSSKDPAIVDAIIREWMESNFLFFKSREKAEEYIALHRPIFTAEEIIKYANMLVQAHSPRVLNDHNFNKGLKEEARRRIFGQVGSC